MHKPICHHIFLFHPIPETTSAMNDPNMSDEDALKSTGEMAEQYLDAVQEFQETQKIGNIETINEDVSIADNGLDGVDDSMDI